MSPSPASQNDATPPARVYLAVFIAAATLIVGLCLGAWVGSWTTCSDLGGCTFSWSAFEALGTWTGAIGGTAAVFLAVMTYRTTERQRLGELHVLAEAQRQAEADQKDRAERVSVRWRLAVTHPGAPSDYKAIVTNLNTTCKVYRVRVDCPAVGRTLVTSTVDEDHLAPTGAVPLTPPEGESGERWLARLRDETRLTYVIDDIEWSRLGDGPASRTR